MAAETKGRVFRRAANDYVVPVGRHATRPRRTGCVRNFGDKGLLNRFNRPPPMAGEAEVRYLDGDFRIVRPGAFVRCAMSGIPIPLEELKYWNVELQEILGVVEGIESS